MDHTYVQAPARRLRITLALRNTYDVLLLAGLALLLPGLLFFSIPLLRIPLGLALVLLAPGYALTAAIFPGRADIDGVTRAALSFGLSAAILPVAALVLDKLQWGITPGPIALSLALWIMLCCGLALWRRQRLALSGEVYTPPVPNLPGWWQTLRQIPRLRYLAGGVALAALTIVSMNLLRPNPSAHPTEFYILGADGLAEGYPRAAAPGDELATTIGIANRELVGQTYRVEVWVGPRWQPEERTLVAQTGAITLSPGQQQEWPITWRMDRAGEDQHVEFLLFTNESSEPYRTLQLWINVVENASQP